MSEGAQLRRNPGPAWGFAFLQFVERRVPWPVLRIFVGLGAGVAVACMPAQRRHSRDYLTVALGRPARWADIWRHFYTYTLFLFLKVRMARGAAHRGAIDPAHPGDFEALMRSGEPAFFGTFHFGHSDLLGFLLGDHYHRRIHMIRLKMGNAPDTRQLGRLFGRWVSFIWVDRPEDLLFALKDAVASGGSLALQCDRLEFTAKTEYFEFLGRRRLFPFTVYHLALLFDRPVIFCLGIPGATRDEMVVQSSFCFRADRTVNRAANLERARQHFQAVLTQLESLVRQYPHLWFNFLPLNPTAPEPSQRVAGSLA